MDASEVDINISTAVSRCDDSLIAQPHRREKRSRRILTEQKCNMFIRHKKKGREVWVQTHSHRTIFNLQHIISHVCIILNFLSGIGARKSLLCLGIDDDKSIMQLCAIE